MKDPIYTKKLERGEFMQIHRGGHYWFDFRYSATPIRYASNRNTKLKSLGIRLCWQ